MELAGQWRREWAGTAEYGKVTEGGVTRQVARAMEVLHASGPGAKVRVMRAAYHSSSGPGIPASSYMLHSSRRVISSGFNLLESPTYPTKPLEISSTPFESSTDLNGETENYKVTEPDDTEISAPSKWRGTSSRNSIRMPSEESSSTDNASIIDLDSRLSHKGLHRKYSYDSENSDNHSIKRCSTRASPLLDAPVTLSTLKYKSLLNGSSDWNNRRKSYSFEDTSPLNEVMLQSNDTLAMESSTDSGICKSTELVNDYTEDTHASFERDHKKSFDHWHLKNKPSPFFKGSKYKYYKEHDIVLEDPLENNITLQSTGKVSITVPITLEGDNSYRSSQINDDGDRKIKKVEFCKTELHFAAESGKVNIIATDEKPPPTNDFRKRRSAFVPINDRFDKPITLFGEKTEFSETNMVDEYGIGVRGFNEPIEFDENTAATKSILKNKIPKPKPYLLGENMVFGDCRKKASLDGNSAPTGVSLINKQLQTKRDVNNDEIVYSSSTVNDRSFRNSLRTTNKSPLRYQSSGSEKFISDNEKSPSKKPSNNDSLRNKFNELHMSPVHKPKTRQLRESELTYFGIDNHYKNVINDKNSAIKSRFTQSQRAFIDDDFESVRLVKKISSTQNSEAESDDSPEYQNLPLKNNFAPIPTPRSRVKYKKPDEGIVILKPIIEQAIDATNVLHEPRRSRNKRQEVNVSSNRSLSEPARKRTDSALQRNDDIRSSMRRDNTNHRYKDMKRNENKEKYKKTITPEANNYHRTSINNEDEVPLYVNINKQNSPDDTTDRYHNSNTAIGTLEKKYERKLNTDNDSGQKRQNSVKKNSRVQRTEKLSTPEYPTRQRSRASGSANTTHKESKNTVTDNNSYSVKHRIKSSQRPNKENEITSHKTIVDEKDKVKSHDVPIVNIEAVHTSKLNTNKKKEFRKNVEPPIKEHGIRLKEIKANDKIGAEKDSGTNGRKTSKRSEYVIKYDDKNGTVSSVSKVRGGHSASRQRHVSKERNKEYPKESKTNEKILKSGLRNAAPRPSQDYKWKKGR